MILDGQKTIVITIKVNSYLFHGYLRKVLNLITIRDMQKIISDNHSLDYL